MDREHLRVDSANHTSLTMLPLRTVEPYGLLVHHTDCVSEDLGSRTDGSVRWHEAGEEGGSHIWHDVLDRYTGLVEGRLDYRVVLGVE